MSSPAIVSWRRSLTTGQAILWGGLIAGILDAIDGVVAFGTQGLNPSQVLQYIASGALGPSAFQGGLATAALGATLHFMIAWAAAGAFVLASRWAPVLRTRAVLFGLLYGMAVYFFMNYVVLPLSAVARGAFNLGLFINGVIGHALFVGLPIALCARRNSISTTKLTRATVVLVHAAWADASSWNKIVQLLQRKEMEVVAVQIPLTSLSDDVAAVRRALKKMNGPVVLAGHSYGGAVITAAGSEDANVKALVYIAAMAPDEGETVGQLLHRAASHASAPALVPDEDGFLWMSAKGFADAVAHESPVENAAVMAATQKPIAVICLGERMTKPAWREKPSWFLVAERDRMIAPETQRFMARRTGGHVLAMEVDHTPLASAPEGVVAIIVDAVDAALHTGFPNPLKSGEHA